tara:strand:- start:21606 stop:22226 length:621 start_codon:yes stop_codon:yes gene_type:complete
MNKRTAFLSTLVLFSILFVNAQSSYGLKAGISYNSNGDLKEFTSEVTNAYKDGGKGKSGFNIGFYGILDLGEIYIRPELVYTKTTSEYVLNSGSLEDYKISKIDVPVLVGFKLLGPIDIMVGPAFQYYLNNDLKGVEISDVENDFSLGMNIGAAINLGRIGFDVRYERGFSKNEAEWTNAGKDFRLDSRPEQIIFSLSYKLSKSKS